MGEQRATLGPAGDARRRVIAVAYRRLDGGRSFAL